jgi:hypothetical protein
MTTDSTPEITPRSPYIGSCHCGRIKYVAFISTPPAVAFSKDGQPPSKDENRARVRFYRCNCTSCHKMNFFHTRLPNAPMDFYLLSPLTLPTKDDDTSGDVLTYLWNNRELDWFFCKACGVRCFASWGGWVEGKLDLEANGVKLPDNWTEILKSNMSADGKSLKVLHLNPDGYNEGKDTYFSLNAVTIEHDQPATKDGKGLNLPEIVDKKWMGYVDMRYETENDYRFTYPHPGGCW